MRARPKDVDRPSLKSHAIDNSVPESQPDGPTSLELTYELLPTKGIHGYAILQDFGQFLLKFGSKAPKVFFRALSEVDLEGSPLTHLGKSFS